MIKTQFTRTELEVIETALLDRVHNCQENIDHAYDDTRDQYWKDQLILAETTRNTIILDYREPQDDDTPIALADISADDRNAQAQELTRKARAFDINPPTHYDDSDRERTYDMLYA